MSFINETCLDNLDKNVETPFLACVYVSAGTCIISITCIKNTEKTFPNYVPIYMQLIDH